MSIRFYFLFALFLVSFPFTLLFVAYIGFINFTLFVLFLIFLPLIVYNVLRLVKYLLLKIFQRTSTTLHRFFGFVSLSFLVYIIWLVGIPLYYTPYSLQPSYWEFKRMCELNELPNNEEKYNKILAYYGLTLDTLDWEELNKRVDTMSKQQYFYSPNLVEYKLFIGEIKNSRYSITASLYSNQKILERNNITLTIMLGLWYTRRYTFSGNEDSGIHWSEITLHCDDIIEYNIPKEINNG